MRSAMVSTETETGLIAIQAEIEVEALRIQETDGCNDTVALIAAVSTLVRRATGRDAQVAV